MSSLIKAELSSHQVEAVNRMIAPPGRFLLADGTGKGKTLAAFASFAELYEQDNSRRMLVLANDKSLSTWTGQGVKHTGFRVVIGSSKSWKKTLTQIKQTDPQVIVLTYSGVKPRKKSQVSSYFVEEVLGKLFGDMTPTGDEWLKTIDLIKPAAVINAFDQNCPNGTLMQLSTVQTFIKKLQEGKRVTKEEYNMLALMFAVGDLEKHWRTWYEAANYMELLKQLYREHPRKMALCLEEAHYCKDSRSLVHQFVKPLLRAAEFGWMLTATPYKSKIEDIYHLMNMLVPGVLGSLKHFYQSYTIRVEKMYGRRKVKEIVGYKNLDKLKEVIKPYILKRVLDYDITFSFPVVSFTSAEEAMYRKVAAGILEDGTEKDFGARLPGLQYIVDGCADDTGEFNDRRILGSKERELLTQIRDTYTADPGRCTIVACYFDLTYRRLKFLLNAGEGKLGYRRVLTADVSDTVEHRLWLEKNLGPGDILLMTSAAKESVNFGAANLMWLYNIPWSIGDTMQIIGRMPRYDSPHSKFEVRVLCVHDTIDDYKVEIWKQKVHLFTSLLKKEATMPDADEVLSQWSLKECRRRLLWRFK